MLRFYQKKGSAKTVKEINPRQTPIGHMIQQNKLLIKECASLLRKVCFICLNKYKTPGINKGTIDERYPSFSFLYNPINKSILEHMKIHDFERYTSECQEFITIFLTNEQSSDPFYKDRESYEPGSLNKDQTFWLYSLDFNYIDSQNVSQLVSDCEVIIENVVKYYEILTKELMNLFVIKDNDIKHVTNIRYKDLMLMESKTVREISGIQSLKQSAENSEMEDIKNFLIGVSEQKHSPRFRGRIRFLPGVKNIIKKTVDDDVKDELEVLGRLEQENIDRENITALIKAKEDFIEEIENMAGQSEEVIKERQKTIDREIESIVRLENLLFGDHDISNLRSLLGGKNAKLRSITKRKYKVKRNKHKRTRYINDRRYQRSRSHR